jgi:hypothetical protein
MRINVSIDAANTFLYDPLKELSELETDPCLVNADLEKRTFSFEGSFDQIRASLDNIITRHPLTLSAIEGIWKFAIASTIDEQGKETGEHTVSFTHPSKWIVCELGDPTDPTWEISVVKRDRPDLSDNFGWGCEDKYIVHYTREPVHPIVVLELRKAAAAILEKFNA